MIARFGAGEFEAYKEWLRSHPAGFIWNVDHRCLHRASCRHMEPGAPVVGGKRRVSKAAPKCCAATKEELLDEFPDARNITHHCSLCNP